MKPVIEKSGFGSITVDGERFGHDVLIRLSGEVKKRKKKLSKEVHGTSHILSRLEAEHIYEKGAAKLIIGSGQDGMLTLSKEAEEYFARKRCPVVLLPTPEAVSAWNASKGAVIGLFHITC